MANLKEAVRSAIAFVADLFPDARDLRLEEVSLAGPTWRVVTSFRDTEDTPLNSLIGGPARVFKEVEVQQESGEPTALKVWKP